MDGSAHTRSTRRRRASVSVWTRTMGSRDGWKRHGLIDPRQCPGRGAVLDGEHRGFDDGRHGCLASRRAAVTARARSRPRARPARPDLRCPRSCLRPAAVPNLRRTSDDPRNRLRGSGADVRVPASSRRSADSDRQPLQPTCSPLQSSLPVPSNGRRRPSRRVAFEEQVGNPSSRASRALGDPDSSSVVSTASRSPSSVGHGGHREHLQVGLGGLLQRVLDLACGTSRRRSC